MLFRFDSRNREYPLCANDLLDVQANGFQSAFRFDWSRGYSGEFSGHKLATTEVESVTEDFSNCLPFVCRTARDSRDGTVISGQDGSTKRVARTGPPVLANRRLQPLGHPSRAVNIPRPGALSKAAIIGRCVRSPSRRGRGAVAASRRAASRSATARCRAAPVSVPPTPAPRRNPYPRSRRHDARTSRGC